MTDLIKELRVWINSLGRYECVSQWVVKEGREILSRHEQEGPLAVLADRKGFNKVQSFKLSDDTWTFWIDGYKIQYVEFFADTYAEAEAKAREWLLKQEDK